MPQYIDLVSIGGGERIFEVMLPRLSIFGTGSANLHVTGLALRGLGSLPLLTSAGVFSPDEVSACAPLATI